MTVRSQNSWHPTGRTAGVAPNRSNPTDPTTDTGCRWALKPSEGAPGPVDGGWWPRSTDPSTEFPPLIADMAASGMAVLRVTYNLNAWDRSDPEIVVGDAAVRMEGVHATHPQSVTLIGPDGTGTRLLVIPPATPGGAARAALRAATDVDSTASVADILEWNNVSVPDRGVGDASPGAPTEASSPVHRSRTPTRAHKTGDDERWESEGGRSDLR
ncbi:hypothetical protein Aglo01_35380 [Actinokineospora globicatena]|nr:hypothetical protein Aglo01_35380 [Actinokineospora globicatena]GLW86534.1 hypothetical protein Aglo02_41730 [Actinokineospora globicatena]